LTLRGRRERKVSEKYKERGALCYVLLNGQYCVDEMKEN